MTGTRKTRPELDIDGARRAAVNLLRVRDRAADDLRDRLIARGAPRGIALRVVAEFTKARLLDDARLARNMIGRELEGGPVGRLRLRDRLERRGIRPRIATAAIDEALAGQSGVTGAMRLARQLARKAHASLGRVDAKVWRRIRATLARRGFEEDEVERAMESIGPPDGSERNGSDTL